MNRLFRSKPKQYSDPALNKNCTELEVNRWIISEFITEHLVAIAGIHPYPLDELMLITTAVTFFKPSYIFEWGTHIGKSARIFYEISKAFNIPCNIHSIDLPDNINHVEHPHEERGIMVKGLKEVTLHQGDGVTKALEIVKTLQVKPQTLFLVDGDHSYESVKRELDTILQNIENPAVLLHDTFYQSEGSKYNIGPHRAISDVIKDKGNEYAVIKTNTGLPGMTLLYRK